MVAVVGYYVGVKSMKEDCCYESSFKVETTQNKIVMVVQVRGIETWKEHM